MKILVIDDEEAARKRLALMLADLGMTAIHQARDGLAALEIIPLIQPDLLLLDIAMPEIDGFDVAARLTDPKPLVVFQTAYDAFALRAFDHEALDYLVKPVGAQHLKRALDRARQRLAQNRASTLDAGRLRQLRGHISCDDRLTRALVRCTKGHRLMPFCDILFFRACEGFVYAMTPDEELLTDYNLTELEGRTTGFLRISRGQLVNGERVVKIQSNNEGSLSLVLDTGLELRVARRRGATIREILLRTGSG